MLKRLKGLIRENRKSDPTPIIEPIDPYKTIYRDFTEEEREDINLVRPFTMTSDERLVTLSRAIEYIVDNDIDGDIVECGVWRGGSMMMAAKKLIRLNHLSKRLYLFDTFEGMSEPQDVDVAWDEVSALEKMNTADKYAGPNVWCYSTIDEVKTNLSKTGYPPAKLAFIKGKVEQTLPGNSIEKISLLRLDTDWYKSTKSELEHLYHKLQIGGILIIDDYGHWQGAKKATDEFIKKKGLKLFLNRIDYTGRLAVKLG